MSSRNRRARSTTTRRCSQYHAGVAKFGKLFGTANLDAPQSFHLGGACMALRLIPFIGIVVGFVTVAGHAFAQQVQPAPKREVNAIEAAQQRAKDAAEFEFLGALARTC